MLECRDVLQQPVYIGDTVAYSVSEGSISYGTVIQIKTSVVLIKPLKPRKKLTVRKRFSAIMRIPEEPITMFVMSQN